MLFPKPEKARAVKALLAGGKVAHDKLESVLEAIFTIACLMEDAGKNDNAIWDAIRIEAIAETLKILTEKGWGVMPSLAVFDQLDQLLNTEGANNG